MSQSIPARRAEGYDCRVMRRHYPEQTKQKLHVPAVMHLETEQAYLAFGGPNERYKPYLVLSGRVQKYTGDFGDSIGEITYERDQDRHSVDYVYELSRENLAELARKGLYEDGFQVPGIVQRNEWELPCQCEIWHNFMELDGRNVPLYFIRPEDGSKEEEVNTLLCADQEMDGPDGRIPGSGYDVASYFEMLPVYGEETESEKEDRWLDADAFDSVFDKMDDTDLEEDAVLAISEEEEAEEMPVDENLEASYARVRADAARMMQEQQEKRLQTEEPAAEPEAVDEPDPEREDASDASHAQERVELNQAANIDTPAELAEEGEDVLAQHGAYVDENVVKEAAKENPERKLPEPVQDKMHAVNFDEPEY